MLQRKMLAICVEAIVSLQRSNMLDLTCSSAFSKARVLCCLESFSSDLAKGMLNLCRVLHCSSASSCNIWNTKHSLGSYWKQQQLGYPHGLKGKVRYIYCMHKLYFIYCKTATYNEGGFWKMLSETCIWVQAPLYKFVLHCIMCLF